MHRFPSEDWTQAYKNAVNHNPAYRRAGKPWTFGSVAIIVQCDLSLGLRQDTGVILDVHEGACRGARFIEGIASTEEAAFVIVGSYQRWKDVIEGKLKLTKGHLPTLIRFVEPSRQLVASACRVPTEFLV